MISNNLVEYLLNVIQSNVYVKLFAGLVGSVLFFKAYFKYKRNQKKAAYPKDVVILHQFPRTINYKIPSGSPFCLKLETWLRMAKIPYQNDFTFQESSKGKIPWITLNGVDVADSQFSIDYIISTLNKNLNSNITNKSELASARAFLKLAEESVYSCIGLFRSVYYPETKRSGFPSVVLPILKSRYSKNSYVQGYGRHTKLEVLQIAKDDLRAINDYIGDRKYLTGDTVCNEDASLFGILAQMYYLHCGEISDFLLTECPNIVRYLDTIKDNFWKDWQDQIRTTPVSSLEFFLSFLRNQI